METISKPGTRTVPVEAEPGAGGGGGTAETAAPAGKAAGKTTYNAVAEAEEETVVNVAQV